MKNQLLIESYVNGNISYVDALNTVLKSDLSIDRVKLEKELNLYI